MGITHTLPFSNVADTAAEAQRMRLLYALRDGPVTTIEARTLLNIFQPAARVKELRDRGFQIITERIRVTDESGRKHSGVARYVLLSECSQEEAA
ncbi:helix-turn-helix domain-containing protein [Chromobacterium paludis]|uniref:Winged helix-turn-helix domain-containing protein n=1 Tax=Chromobacterium paludis TaxID=2605945 RepID=A0A5C1DJ16_9NEIS|nr:helix-turn-helix domain-containing protein [Chromobacterium paludis]QEL56602.1 hypothetical protein FYK34_14025 [Chromobacterium paludis]